MGSNVEDMKAERNVLGLIDTLKAQDWLTRRDAVKALGELRDPRAVEPIIQTLREAEHNLGREDFDFQLHFEKVVASALGKIGEPAVKPLIQTLRDEGPYATVHALKSIGSPAVQPLIQCLEDKNATVKVRRHASYALGKIEDPRGVEPLIQALKDEDTIVRKNAITYLGEMGVLRTVEPLIQALKDVDGDIRASAANALGQIGDERAIKPLIQVMRNDKSEFVRKDASLALTMIEKKKKNW